MKTVRWFAVFVVGNLAATAPASTVLSATAYATPSESADAVIISQATVDGVDYITREITVAPGGSTGWHYHDGRVFGVMKSGKLTHVDSDCSATTYRAGQTIIEPEGTDQVHIGRNDTNAPLVLYALYVLPVGAPFAEDA